MYLPKDKRSYALRCEWAADQVWWAAHTMHKLTWWLCIVWDTGMQGYRDTGMQVCRDTGMQGCRDAGMQGYRDAGMQGYRDAGMQGCMDDTILISFTDTDHSNTGMHCWDTWPIAKWVMCPSSCPLLTWTPHPSPPQRQALWRTALHRPCARCIGEAGYSYGPPWTRCRPEQHRLRQAVKVGKLVVCGWGVQVCVRVWGGYIWGRTCESDAGQSHCALP